MDEWKNRITKERELLGTRCDAATAKYKRDCVVLGNIESFRAMCREKRAALDTFAENTKAIMGL